MAAEQLGAHAVVTRTCSSGPSPGYSLPLPCSTLASRCLSRAYGSRPPARPARFSFDEPSALRPSCGASSSPVWRSSSAPRRHRYPSPTDPDLLCRPASLLQHDRRVRWRVHRRKLTRRTVELEPLRVATGPRPSAAHPATAAARASSGSPWPRRSCFMWPWLVGGRAPINPNKTRVYAAPIHLDLHPVHREAHSRHGALLDPENAPAGGSRGTSPHTLRAMKSALGGVFNLGLPYDDTPYSWPRGSCLRGHVVTI